MNREELIARLAEATRIELRREVWETAAILAGLRVAANDPIRANDRNRGEDKNWLADIGGTIGEIAAVHLVNHICDAPIVHHPIDFERSVDDVDLVVGLDDGPLRLETKAHVLAPGKRYFLVNERARRRSFNRGAEGYLPLITSLGAERAHVGALLTTSVVGSWKAPPIYLKDPAVGPPLAQIAASSFGQPLSDLEKTLPAGAVLAEGHLSAIAAQAGAQFEAWRDELPDLGELTAKKLVDALTKARTRIDPA